MTICKEALFIVIVHLMLSGITFAGQGFLWRPLTASYSRLLNGSRRSGSHDLPTTTSIWSSNMTCSLACHQVEWCNVWCPDPSSTASCLFFDMFVVPGYQETNMDDALDCYTRNPKDYAVGATIEGETAYPLSPWKVKENLIDGIYDFGVIGECYMSSDQSDPWFKLDIGSEKPIRLIKMILQPNDYVQYFYDYEVRVGSQDASPGDFSTYKLFGYFPGPSSANQEIVFHREHPILARYVSVQRWSQASCSQVESCMLQICHIEIN